MLLALVLELLNVADVDDTPAVELPPIVLAEAVVEVPLGFVAQLATYDSWTADQTPTCGTAKPTVPLR